MLKYSLKYGLSLSEIYLNPSYFSNFMKNLSDAVDILIIHSIENEIIKDNTIKDYLTTRYFFVNKFYPIINYLNYKNSYLSYGADKETISYLENSHNDIDWDLLSCNKNPEAIKILLSNPDKIIWSRFSTNLNKYTINIFRENLEKIMWNQLFHSYLGNIDYEGSLLIRENLDKIIDWDYLSFSDNRYIIEIIIENIDKLGPLGISQLSLKNYDFVIDYLLESENINKINWEYFSLNTNDKAVLYLKKNPNNIHWLNFSLNHNKFAIKILKENLDKVYLPNLLLNPNDELMDLFFKISDINSNEDNELDYSLYNAETLRDNLHNLQYNKNPRVIDLIYKICNKFGLDFKDNIDYSNLGIFEITYDYKFIRERIGNTYCEELMAFYWDPKRYDRWCEKIFEDSYVIN